MKNRHRAREVALQILYQYDMASQSDGKSAPTGAALASDLRKHFDHFQVADPLREFAGELVGGTLREMKELDERLERQASNWRISRMSFVDRNLLRMSLYEMRHFPETATAVVIDEAVELAKQFGTAESPAFINGVLDAIAQAAKAEPATNGKNLPSGE